MACSISLLSFAVASIPYLSLRYGLYSDNMLRTPRDIDDCIFPFSIFHLVNSTREITSISTVPITTAVKIVVLPFLFFKISIEQIDEILGVPMSQSNSSEIADIPGVVTGLAWTSVGGDILFIESILSEGKGSLTMTGNLGNVMKESATLSLEYIKAKHKELGISLEDITKKNIHIHVPEGATPKDGPSAGIAMLTSMVSSFTQKKVKPNLAMTGEITLRGRVLPVGGIKEKLLAAIRSRVKEVILCENNKKDVEDIKGNYFKNLKIHYVSTMNEVIQLALK